MKTLLITTGIVLLWALASGVYGWLIQWVPPCISLGVALCALLLLITSHNENAWQRLTWQPYDDEESPGFLLFFLVGIPFIILFMAFVEALRRWVPTLF